MGMNEPEHTDEKCNWCGEMIGYAPFDAHSHTMPDNSTVIHYTHYDQSTCGSKAKTGGGETE